jgi:hypothetical protein
VYLKALQLSGAVGQSIFRSQLYGAQPPLLCSVPMAFSTVVLSNEGEDWRIGVGSKMSAQRRTSEVEND